MKKTFSFLSLLLFCAASYAQLSDPIALRINNKPISKSELEKAYRERAMENESVYDFIESYIDLKLNIEEAKAQKLDTTGNYKRSHSTFKIQLAKEYDKDTITEPKILKSFYDRMLEDVELNHTFIPFDKEPLFPRDTISTYKKALKLKKELSKKGFTDKKKYPDLATLGYALPSYGESSGYLGWVAPFMLPIEVEDMMYKISLNEISRPIRSKDGFHIIQVLNRRPTVGIIDIDQVTFGFSDNPASKQEIDSMKVVTDNIYKKLLTNPEIFAQLCYSYNQANNIESTECNFGEYGLDVQFPSSFRTAAFGLTKEGEISAPVLTDFGYHFIKLNKRLPIAPLEDMHQELKDKIARGNRSGVYTKMKHKALFDQYNVSVNQEVYGEIVDMANKMNPLDSVFINKIIDSKDELFTINEDEIYLVRDFASHLESKRAFAKANKDAMMMGAIMPVVNYTISTENLENMFHIYISRAIGAYADSTIETRIPAFASIMDMYMEGTLLYEVKKINVWNKVKANTGELSKYFAKNKSKYKWDSPRYKGLIIHCKDKAVADQLGKISENESKDIEKLISDIDTKYNTDSIAVSYQQGVWEKGENTYIDNYLTETVSKTKYKGYPYTVVVAREIKEPETYLDVIGLVESDYQTLLEEEWNLSLRQKYRVDVDHEVLKTIE